jgi:hypothetical protein
VCGLAAYALTDSPTGLAAWIAEEFSVWTDHDDDLERAVDLDSLLTNITLDWVTAALNSSFWPYHAVRHEWATRRTPRGTGGSRPARDGRDSLFRSLRGR